MILRPTHPQELCKRYKLNPEIAARATYLEELYTRDLSKEVTNQDIKPAFVTKLQTPGLGEAVALQQDERSE